MAGSSQIQGPVAEVGKDVADDDCDEDECDEAGIDDCTRVRCSADRVRWGDEARSGRGEAGSRANLTDLLMACFVVDGIFTRHDREYDDAIEHVDSSPAVVTFSFRVIPAVEVKGELRRSTSLTTSEVCDYDFFRS